MNYPQQFNQPPYPTQYSPGGYGAPMMDTLAQMRAPYAQPTASQQQSGSVIWVQGEEGAKAYMVAAGNSVMLLDSENSTFYIKSTDQSGMPLPLRVFDYTERAQNAKTAQASQPALTTEYITRAEFEAAIARLSGKKKKDAEEVARNE